MSDKYEYEELDDEKEKQNTNDEEFNIEEEAPTSKLGLCWFRFVNCFDYFRKSKKKVSDESFEGEQTEELSQEKSQSLRETIQMLCLLIIAIVAVGVALIYLEFVLVPLVMAWFLVYLFQPFINFLVGKKAIFHDKLRIRLPRLIAVVIVAIVVVVLILILGVAVYFSVRDLIEDSDKYIERIDELKGDILEWAETVGLESQLEELIPRIDVGNLFVAFLAEATVFIPQAFLCILFTIYMLLDYDETKEKTPLQRNIDQQIRKYIVLKVVLSILTTTIIAIVYASLSLDMWVLFAFLTFLLNFIPNVGCMIAVLLPLPIVLLDTTQTWWSILLIFLIPILIHFFVGNFLEPKVMGKSMDMSAIAVLVALAFWGSVWGIVGTFISVPLTVVLHLWLRSVPNSMAQFFADILAGKFEFVQFNKKMD